MGNDTDVRDTEIAGITEGLWAAILDEQAQAHQPTQSQYRFCTVFLEYLASRDGCSCPAIAGPELDYFTNHILRFLNGMSLSDNERIHILSTLFERICMSLARPHKLGT